LNSRGSTVSYRIEGGNDRLPTQLATRVDVRYGTPVIGVTQDDRGVEVVIGAGGVTQTLKADRLVCAIPTPVIGRLFDRPPRRPRDHARRFRMTRCGISGPPASVNATW
jgi:monoamine oxidase